MAERHPIPSDKRFQDLTGKQFGKLSVLFYAGRKNSKTSHYSLWHCLCECGEEITIVSSRLTLGQTTHCQECFRHGPSKRRRLDIEDLTGRRFGRLVALEVGEKSGKRVKWLCQCDCGEKCSVRSDTLKGGKTISCGCAVLVQPWTDLPKPGTMACTHCEKVLPFTLNYFYLHKASRWGIRPKCKECTRKAMHKVGPEWRKKRRMEVLVHYSGEVPKCACCGESFMEFLTIDHVLVSGKKEKRDNGYSNLYNWLKKQGYPDGYQVLCYNCNCSLGRYGYCPHHPEIRREVISIPRY